MQTLMNAHGVGEVALAGATSNLFAMLADSYRRSKRIKSGDEIIIHDSSHEVIVPIPPSAWARLPSAMHAPPMIKLGCVCKPSDCTTYVL